MATLDETPILELGRQPIAGGEPTGADLADDSDYIAVLAELQKLDRIEATAPPDWHTVEPTCLHLLSHKTKDVELAGALGMALFQRCGYAGLAASLGLLTGLISTFWDKLYPARPRRRKARIEALADRFTEGVELRWFARQPKADEFDAVDKCLARAKELSAALAAHFPDERIELEKFIKALGELASKRPKADAPPAAASQAAPGAPAASGGVGGGPAFTASEVTDAGGALRTVREAATFLRTADPSDPIPYALIRVLKWTRTVLPTSEAARTQIQPPEGSTLDTLTHQSASGMWDNLLKNAEAAFRANDALWLDLQRYVCTAMAGLGSKYDLARQTVLSMTASLVQRLGPGVYELRFRNGTPLVAGDTRLWIEAETRPAGGRSSGDMAAGNGRLVEATDKARKLAGEGKIREALEELQTGASTSTQRRDRFLWRLRIAQLCFDAQRLQLAAPLLEECHEQIRRYHIDEWEPTLAVDVAQTLYRCRKQLVSAQKEPGRESLDGVRDSFAWLCQLDPVAALAAEPMAK